MTRLAAALVLVALAPAAAHAKCAPSATGGTSANKKWKIEPTIQGKFALLGWDESKKDFVKRTEGTFEVFGHHLKGHVTDDGEHWVLHDSYEGLAIYAKDGALVKRLTADELLTKDEAEKRPNKWACHPEGEWSNGKVELGDAVLKVGTHAGRTVELELATGKSWVEEGSCATPGQVKAHGLMNCISVKWTCPRCKKEQESLRWRLCEACCKELHVCNVCNKKVDETGKK